MPNAIILLSGGIDSTTTAAIAADRGFDLYALSFAYGQRHDIEIAAARRIAGSLNVKHHVIQSIDLRAFGGSALTGDIDVPLDRDLDFATRDRGTSPCGRPGSDPDATDADGASPEIPVTYVPARNTVFLALALAYAETVGAFDIFIGANAVDYSGYPDCRPAFIAKFQELANLATAAAVEHRGRFNIHAPLIDMTKADIICTGVRLGVDFSITHSCYAPTPSGLACGRCDSCRLRARGFTEAGIPDPTRYA